MDRPDDLLEEPLYIDGAFVRRWDEFPRLPRVADTGRAVPRAVPLGDVPRPRPADAVGREAVADG